jgi:hypothetical protein
MKNKTILFLFIISLAAIILSLNHGQLFAQQQQAAMGKAGEPVEFSNLSDKQAEEGSGGFWGLGGLDPLQVVYTEPNDVIGAALPSNSTFDFGTSGEVDALANGGDIYLYEVKANTATLIISFQSDPASNAVWYETPPGAKGIKWTQLNLVNEVAGHRIDDLDALEVWGPVGSDDAGFYSLQGDPGGVSVLYFQNPGSVTYISQSIIQAAVTSLGYSGPTVDLDALMVFESQGVSGNKIWDTGDIIIFSIRASGNWDGGEIVVFPFGGPASFLNHGGHLWNTAFNVGTAFGVSTEEVDAIEAIPYKVDGPVLTEWGIMILVILLMLSALFILLKKRKSTVPA